MATKPGLFAEYAKYYYIIKEQDQLVEIANRAEFRLVPVGGALIEKPGQHYVTFEVVEMSTVAIYIGVCGAEKVSTEQKQVHESNLF